MATCDWDHNTKEARVLPTGAGNVILCHWHYLAELRQYEDNVKSGLWADDGFPKWEDLKIYEEA